MEKHEEGQVKCLCSTAASMPNTSGRAEKNVVCVGSGMTTVAHFTFMADITGSFCFFILLLPVSSLSNLSIQKSILNTKAHN